MKSEFSSRIFNLLIRGISTLSKFALVMSMAKFLTLEEVGTYGLLAATISLSVILIGGEFYTYSQRELLSVDLKKWPSILKNQGIASAVLYFIFLPAQLIIFYQEFITFNLLAIFYVILILEHIAQELSRILIAMHKQLFASVVMFLRIGAWCWIVIGLFYIDISYRTLDTVLYLWVLGATVAIITSIIYIHNLVPTIFEAKADWKWIKKGYRVALRFFLSTVTIKIIMTFDRFIVETIAGREFLGVYAVYAGMAMVVNSVLVPTVFSFLYPRLVENFRKEQFKLYKKNFQQLLFLTLLIGGSVAFIVGALAPFAFNWVEKPIYVEQINYLWWLLLFSFLYCLSMVPHYVLYAKGKDGCILISNLFGAFVFFIGAILCYLKDDIDVLFWTLSSSMFVLVVVKSLFGAGWVSIPLSNRGNFNVK